MKRSSGATLVAVLAGFAVSACGSSGHGARTSTTSSASAAQVHGNTVVIRQPGTAGKRTTLAMLGRAQVPPRRPQAHIAGLGGPLPQQLQAMAEEVSAFWQWVFRHSGAQLSAVTQNIVEQQPAVCGSTTVASSDPPEYCVVRPSVDLPVGYFARNVAPLGNAATLLLVADTYGFHVEDALQAFNDGYSDSTLKEVASCLSGLLFSQALPNAPNPNNPSAPYLEPSDLEAVNSELARESSASGGASSAGSVTTAELTSAFNRGVSAGISYRQCLPAAAGGTLPTS